MRVHPCQIANALWRLAAAAGSNGWARHAQSLLRSRHSGRGGAASHGSWRHGRIVPAGRPERRPVPHTPLLFVPKRQRRLGTATLETPRTVREIRKASAHRARAGHCEIAPFRPPFSGVFTSIAHQDSRNGLGPSLAPALSKRNPADCEQEFFPRLFAQKYPNANPAPHPLHRSKLQSSWSRPQARLRV